MWRINFVLLGLVCAFHINASTNKEVIAYLNSRTSDLPNGRGTLIKSFATSSQSYIYDQALAIITYTREFEQQAAKKLLSGLSNLQLSDGSLYFSYFLDGTSPYPTEGDKRIAGAMSWVALSAIYYQYRFKSKDFLSFNHKLLSYLQTQILPIELKGKKYSALAFSPHDISSTNFAENDVAALEHNLDAYSAFYHYAKINKNPNWTQVSLDIKHFILAMWDPDKSHFWPGASFKNKAINRSELYLDNQSWSLLALDDESLLEIAPDLALQKNCEYFFAKHQGIIGFIDSKATRRPASHEFVWSEGTLGQIMAMKKIKQSRNMNTNCRNFDSEDFLASIKKMKQPDGGISYATDTDKKDFTSSSSVAGTTWLYFAINNFNPFNFNRSD